MSRLSSPKATQSKAEERSRRNAGAGPAGLPRPQPEPQAFVSLDEAIQKRVALKFQRAILDHHEISACGIAVRTRPPREGMDDVADAASLQ